MSKYDPLGHFLAESRFNEVSMTFAEIEHVLGFPLPEKSKRIRAWWSNNADNSVLTKVWLEAGFRSEQVDMGGQKLVFRRTTPIGLAEGQGTFSGAPSAEPKKPRRHPAFGALKDVTWIAPGVDLTEPADPEWADIVEDPKWNP
jgi:hypothetical protein